MPPPRGRRSNLKTAPSTIAPRRWISNPCPGGHGVSGESAGFCVHLHEGVLGAPNGRVDRVELEKVHLGDRQDRVEMIYVRRAGRERCSAEVAPVEGDHGRAAASALGGR